MKYKGKITDDLDLVHGKWSKNNLVQKVDTIPTSDDIPLNHPFMWIGATTPYGDKTDFFRYGRIYKLTENTPAIEKITGLDGITDVTIDGETVVEDDTAKIKTDQKTIKNDATNGLTLNNAKELWDLIYPVGSVYISMSEDPNSKFTGTTWAQITDCTLWATASGGGEELAGSLPNIQGYVNSVMVDSSSSVGFSGAFYNGGTPRSRSWSGTGGNDVRAFGFKASNSNSIYNATAGANVVRPTSIAVMMWQRTA